MAQKLIMNRCITLVDKKLAVSPVQFADGMASIDLEQKTTLYIKRKEMLTHTSSTNLGKCYAYIPQRLIALNYSALHKYSHP